MNRVTSKMHKLSGVDVSDVPREFRILKAGANETTKGIVTYAGASRSNILRMYAARKIDVMIDLEHLSLDPESKGYNPDAMGWCKLEDREGELWAANVRWTPEGIERLKAKKQRYISPVIFFQDEKKETAELIFNLALCAVPATFEAVALVAAKASANGDDTMEINAVKAALGLPEEATLDDVLAALEALKLTETPEDPEAVIEGTDTPEASPETAPEAVAVAEVVAETVPEVVEVVEGALEAVVAALTEENTRLTEELAGLKAKAEGDDVAAVLKANAHKIPAHLEAFCATLKADQLRAFCATLKDKAPAARPVSKPSGNATVKLTAAEEHVAKVTGISREAILATKTRKAQTKA